MNKINLFIQNRIKRPQIAEIVKKTLIKEPRHFELRAHEAFLQQFISDSLNRLFDFIDLYLTLLTAFRVSSTSFISLIW